MKDTRASMADSAATSPSRRSAAQALSPASTKPEGQWHHGDLRAALIAWGTHLLDTEGPAGMSMRAAAKRAGVSQGAPAHHFGDRNGLLAAIAAQGFRDMVALRQERLAEVDPLDASARLRAVILAYVEFAQAHPARFHLMFGPEILRRKDYPELIEEGRRSFEMVRDAVRPFLSEARAGSLSAEDVAFAIWSATHGLATLTLHGMRAPVPSALRTSPRQLGDAVVQFCLWALGAGPLPPPSQGLQGLQEP